MQALNKNGAVIKEAITRKDVSYKSLKYMIDNSDLLCIKSGDKYYIPLYWSKNFVAPVLGVVGVIAAAVLFSGDVWEIDNPYELNEYRFKVIENKIYKKKIQLEKKPLLSMNSQVRVSEKEVLEAQKVIDLIIEDN